MRAGHNYLAALADAAGALGLAWLDVSTGDFVVQPATAADLAAALARLEPGELLLPDRLLQQTAAFRAVRRLEARRCRRCPQRASTARTARRRLETLYGVGASKASAPSAARRSPPPARSSTMSS